MKKSGFIILFLISFCLPIKQIYATLADTSRIQLLKKLTNEGLESWKLGDFDKSMEQYRNLLKLSEQSGNKKYQAMALNNIGFIYAEFGNDEKTLEYYKEALKIRIETKDTLGTGLSYNNIGRLYFKMDSMERSLHHYLQSLQILSEIHDSLGESNVLNNIGNVYIEMNELEQALDFHNRSLTIRKVTNDYRGIAESYKNISKIFILQKRYNEAEGFLNKGIEIAKRIESRKLLMQYYYKLYELNTQQELFEEALISYIKYVEINDSLFSIESKNKIAELEIQYQTEKKEQKIKLLKIQDQIKADKIIRKNKIIRTTISVTIIFLLMLIIVSNMYLQRRKAYKKLVSMNIEANENEQIMVESIMENQDTKKYQGSNLDEARKQELLNNLIILMEEEKFYLNPGFSIEDLSKKLDTNRQYLSQLINEQFSKNFNSFINEYRIKEARRLLILDENKKYTIEGISKIVGFNSRTSFISAFKKHTGVTPSFFINNYQDI